MGLENSPLAPQQVAFKRVCSRIYSAYGDEFRIHGIESTREYVIDRITKQLMPASEGTIVRVHRLVEGYSEGMPPPPAASREHRLGIIILLLNSASWETLVLVIEALQGDVGQAEAPGRHSRRSRKRIKLPILTRCVAHLRRVTRAAAAFPLGSFIKLVALQRVALPVLGFVLAVLMWSASFLVWIVIRRSRSETRLREGRRCARGGRYAPARPEE